MNSVPKPLEDLIESLEELPGIGPRGASRLAYFLLRAPDRISQNLAETLLKLKNDIKVCKVCYNYSGESVCLICSNAARADNKIMVVENPLDVVAFENVGVFLGVYHVLGGLISPMQGIGPEEIRLGELIKRLVARKPGEVILATNLSLEGESTSMFIKHEIEHLDLGIRITRLARGLPTGADLEYADSMTLKRSLEGRLIY